MSPVTVMTSSDGTLWTPRAVAGSDVGSCVADNGSLVVVGGDVIATSPDGVTWTSQTTPSFSLVTGVAWSAALSLWCAVGYGTNPSHLNVMTSPDGITWTARGTYFNGPYGVAQDVISLPGNPHGTILAPSAPSFPVTFTGEDGDNTFVLDNDVGGSPNTFTIAPGTYEDLASLAYAMTTAPGTLFGGVALSSWATVSSDGDVLLITWNVPGMGATFEYIYGNALSVMGWTSSGEDYYFQPPDIAFVAVGFNRSVGALVQTSVDGSTWVTQTTPFDGEGYWGNHIAYDGTNIVATFTNAGNTESKLGTSTDGVTWTDITPPPGPGDWMPLFGVGGSDDSLWVVGGRQVESNGWSDLFTGTPGAGFTPETTNPWYDDGLDGRSTIIQGVGWAPNVGAVLGVEIDAPADIAEGNLLIAVIIDGDLAANTVTPPVGWTLYDTHGIITPSSSVTTFYKYAGASEPSSYIFACPDPYLSGAILQYANTVTSGNPFDGFPGYNDYTSGSDTDFVAAGLTAATSGEMMVFAVMTCDGTPGSVPSGMTQRTTDTYAALTTYDESVSAGATPAETSVLDYSDSGMTATMLIKPGSEVASFVSASWGFTLDTGNVPLGGSPQWQVTGGQGIAPYKVSMRSADGVTWVNDTTPIDGAFVTTEEGIVQSSYGSDVHWVDFLQMWVWTGAGFYPPSAIYVGAVYVT